MTTKKIFILFISIVLFWSCENIPDGVIEPTNVDYSVVNISAPNSVIYSESNILTTTITIKNTSTIENVWFNINSFDDSEQITSLTLMMSTQVAEDKIYTGQIEIDQNLLPGNYILNYYVEDNVRIDTENLKKVGSKKFQFQIEAENFPPVLSDLLVPTSVTGGGNFLLEVKVIDPNGPEDIEEVNFEIFDSEGNKILSDSTNGISKFKMFDDGKSGDKISKDGIYSSNFAFDKNLDLGTWKFIFYSVDSENSISDTLEAEITTIENFTPSISNLVMPQEVERDAFFPFSIDVEDPNGLTDIDSVHYQLFDPSGNLISNSENISKFPMFDDGDTNINGDETEGDGTYTVVLRFPESVETGDWEFRFNAVDKAGQVSNTITNSLKVN
jgi:hypothetical protein